MAFSPLSPIADLAPVRTPERAERPARHDEKFAVRGDEAPVREPRRADRAIAGESPARPPVGRPTDSAPKAVDARSPAGEPTAVRPQRQDKPAGAPGTEPASAQTLTDTMLVAAEAVSTQPNALTAAGGTSPELTGEGASPVRQVGQDADNAATTGLPAGVEMPSLAVADANAALVTRAAAPVTQGAPARTGVGAAVLTPQVASVVRPVDITGSTPAATGAAATTGTDAEPDLLPRPGLFASGGGQQSTPQSGADQGGTQGQAGQGGQNQGAATAHASMLGSSILAAQALASSPMIAAAPDVASLPQSIDLAGVSQNFHAEMRGALDGPTQAAAYTARSAITAQPAVEQVALQISRAIDQNADRLTVHLKPAELGKVTIELEVKPDNRIIAVISAERAETLDLLQRDARSLERALNEAGLKTDSGSLEFNLRGDGDANGGDTDTDSGQSDARVLLSGQKDTPPDPYASADGYGPYVVPDGRVNIHV